MLIPEDIKNIKKNLPFKATENEKGDPINALPEYKIRTMKGDLAELGLVKLEKEAKIPQPSEKIEVISKPLVEKREPKRAPLPSAEELVTEKAVEPIPAPPPSPPQHPPAPVNLPIEKEEVKPAKKPVKKPVYRKPIYQPDFIKAIRSKKRLKFLVILIIIFLVLFGIGSFFYWQGKKQPSPPKPVTENQQPEKPKPSESLIAAEEIKTPFLIGKGSLLELLKKEAGTDQPASTFKRIAVLKNEKEFLSLNEVLQELEITPPPYVLTELKENYNLVLYSSQNGKKHLGLITEVKNSTNLKEQLRFWEETMVNDLRNIFLTTPGQPAASKFQDNIYPPTAEAGKQAAIRYINFPEPDLTIDYAIMGSFFVLTTSKESMYKIIDRIMK